MYKSFMLSIFSLLVLNGCGEGKDSSSTTNSNIVSSDIIVPLAQEKSEQTTKKVVAQQPQKTATSASQQQPVQTIAPLQPIQVPPQQTAHGKMVTATPPHTSVDHLGLSSTAQPNPQSMSADKQAATIVSAKHNNITAIKTESDIEPSIEKTTAALPTEAVPPILDPVAEHADEKNNTTDTKTAALPTEADPLVLDPVTEHAVDLWHPEPGPVVLPPEPAEPAIELVPNTITPIIQVRDHTFPNSSSILDGELNRPYDESVTAQWLQEGKPEPLGSCELAGAKKSCHLELSKLTLNSKPIRLCLNNGNCASLELPKVTFIGQLNYKGTVTAELSGFSDNLTTRWYLFQDNDSTEAINRGELLPEGNNLLSLALYNTEYNYDFYVHQYLFFCIADNNNHWPQQCINVGSQANELSDMQNLLSTTYQDISLVGGALADEHDAPAIRRIAPVPVLWTSRNEQIYRPLTKAELAAIQIQLNKKYVSYRQDRRYPQLPYKEERYPAEQYFSYWQFGDAQSLCAGEHMADKLPSIETLQQLSLSELRDSGWPTGDYWSSSSADIRNWLQVMNSQNGKLGSADKKYPNAFIACQAY